MTKLVLAVVLLCSLAAAQLPATVPMGAVILGQTNLDTGNTYISVGLNSRYIMSAHLADVIVDVSGTQVHTGPIDTPVQVNLYCAADVSAEFPAPPYRYIAVQLQFNDPQSPLAGAVILADAPNQGVSMPVYGLETFIMVPRLGQEYLHQQTVKPNTAGQALAIVVHKCPVAANMPVGCQ